MNVWEGQIVVEREGCASMWKARTRAYVRRGISATAISAQVYFFTCSSPPLPFSSPLSVLTQLLKFFQRCKRVPQ
jgi:hypothetical protein